MQKGQWILLPYELVKDLPNLRLSPLGVVAQCDCHPCVIINYTFNGVNEDTIRLASREAMQFGRALQGILETILNANPQYGPIHLIKVDIANGFYRVWVNSSDIPKLGVIFPTLPNSEPLVAFPPSPPYGLDRVTALLLHHDQNLCGLSQPTGSTHGWTLSLTQPLSPVSTRPWPTLPILIG
jgi:hypothetical protein